MYDRWGMDPAEASKTTGVELDADALDAAEAELVDTLGRAPDPDRYGDDDPRARAFGRAVAWQAAHRAGTPAAAGDGGQGIVSEEVGSGDYRVQYATPVDEHPEVAPRARKLLTRHGWFAATMTGRAATRPHPPVSFQ